jgi:hypothetical protein
LYNPLKTNTLRKIILLLLAIVAIITITLVFFNLYLFIAALLGGGFLGWELANARVKYKESKEKP